MGRGKSVNPINQRPKTRLSQLRSEADLKEMDAQRQKEIQIAGTIKPVDMDPATGLASLESGVPQDPVEEGLQQRLACATLSRICDTAVRARNETCKSNSK